MRIERRAKPSPRKVRCVRYRPDEWALVKARAAAEGIDPSTFVRECSVRVAREELAAEAVPGQ